MPNDTFGYDEKLPEDIRDIFMWLCQDVAALYYKWHFYSELYSKEENTKLLSRLALSSFNIIEESLRSDLTMSICRLRDPACTAGKHNLSFEALIKKSSIDGMDELLEEFQDACEPIRQYRNKRVGHNDLKTTIEPHENPLPGIGKRDIDNILAIAGRILNSIYQNYTNSELGFDYPLYIGGADTLLYWLKLGEKYQETDILEAAGYPSRSKLES